MSLQREKLQAGSVINSQSEGYWWTESTADSYHSLCCQGRPTGMETFPMSLLIGWPRLPTAKSHAEWPEASCQTEELMVPQQCAEHWALLCTGTEFTLIHGNAQKHQGQWVEVDRYVKKIIQVKSNKLILVVSNYLCQEYNVCILLLPF